ncbi:MAG: hypothetical protein JWM68_3934, partial [Verrucomicrobiales bacterium]|nr:hypothetical protein [Verrucomicrobiales bacterium]
VRIGRPALSDHFATVLFLLGTLLYFVLASLWIYSFLGLKNQSSRLANFETIMRYCSSATFCFAMVCGFVRIVAARYLRSWFLRINENLQMISSLFCLLAGLVYLICGWIFQRTTDSIYQGHPAIMANGIWQKTDTLHFENLLRSNLHREISATAFFISIGLAFLLFRVNQE